MCSCDMLSKQQHHSVKYSLIFSVTNCLPIQVIAMHLILHTCQFWSMIAILTLADAIVYVSQNHGVEVHLIASRSMLGAKLNTNRAPSARSRGGLDTCF